MREVDSGQETGMESESGGGDWRPFLFFGRMSFGEESGDSWIDILLVN